MSAYNCLKAKIGNGTVAKKKGTAALKRIKEIREALERQGEPLHIAQGMAERRYAEEAKHAATTQKWRLINRVRVARQFTAKVKATAPADLAKMARRMADDTDFEARAVHKQIMGRVGAFLEKHRVTLTGNVSNPANFREFMKALVGEPTQDTAAKALADAANDVNEWIRKKLNSYGHSIGKLDGWGMPHRHNAEAISAVPVDEWAKFFDDDLDWENMINPKTGLEFMAKPPEAFRLEFHKAARDNILYGRNSKAPSWTQGGTGSALERHRVYRFKTSEGWLKYNQRFGSADPHSTLLSHWDQMSREIALGRTFGPDAEAAVDFLGQIIAKKNRDTDSGLVTAMKGQGGVAHAKGMVRVMQGGIGPQSHHQAVWARRMSTVRKGLTAALLDRASVISVPSDLNSMNIASMALGQNPSGWFPTYMGLMADAAKGGGATRNELLVNQHIAESWANPGVTLARYASDYPAAAWAEKLSNASMKIQGMNAHTDSAKLSMQWAMSGWMGSYKHLALGDIPPMFRTAMERAGITERDWDTFRSGPTFTASNGAEMLDPLQWQVTTTIDPVEADRIFRTFQTFVEKWTELAVPSRSLMAQGVLNPSAYDLAPGSFLYEGLKSIGMFKSFVGAFVINQARLYSHMPNLGAKAAYVIGMVGSTTLVGAVAVQTHNLLLGRDPEDITQPGFLWRSMLRGGGLGPAGDLLATGATSWGGGPAGYLGGPVVGAAGDVLELSFGNVVQAYNQAMDGDDVDIDFMEELMAFQKRYTPMWQTPLAAGGIALDRIISDQMVLLLDPGALDDMVKSQKRTDNLNGRGTFWMPGSPIPNRMPNFGSIVGR